MTDIVGRLRASVTQCRAVDRSELLAEAAAEIARLRGDAELARLRLEAAHAEIDRLRLTGAEREAVDGMLEHYARVYDQHGASVDDDRSLSVIRRFVKRTK